MLVNWRSYFHELAILVQRRKNVNSNFHELAILARFANLSLTSTRPIGRFQPLTALKIKRCQTALAVPAGTSGFTVAAFEAGSRESCDIIY